jgi:hypothetical protein
LETLTLMWFVVLVCLSAVACQTTTDDPTTEGATPSPQTEAPPNGTAAPENAWTELFTRDGITLTIRIPRGWVAETNDEGVILAEHMGTMETGGVLDGVQVHCFIHPVSDSATPEGRNRAVQILSKIVTDPTYINPDDMVNEPVGFTWDGYDAAYYLLNNGDDSLKMLLALAVSDQRLVACSISAPWRLSARIRGSVPTVLSTLTINGHQLDGSSLHDLPDPLEFPDYPLETTAETP